MASNWWSGITEQISSVAKDVLTEGTEEVDDHATALKLEQNKSSELGMQNQVLKNENERLNQQITELNESLQSSELQVGTLSTEYRNLLRSKEDEISLLKQNVEEFSSLQQHASRYTAPQSPDENVSHYQKFNKHTGILPEFTGNFEDEEYFSPAQEIVCLQDELRIAQREILRWKAQATMQDVEGYEEDAAASLKDQVDFHGDQDNVETFLEQKQDFRKTELLIEQLQQEVTLLTTQREAALSDSIKQQQASQKKIENLQKQLEDHQNNEKLIERLQHEVELLSTQNEAALNKVATFQSRQDDVEALQAKNNEVLVTQLQQEIKVLTASNITAKQELETFRTNQNKMEILQKQRIQQNESLITELQQEITSLKLTNETTLNDSLKLQTSQHEIQNLHQQVQNLQKNETLVEQLQQEVELLSIENEAALNKVTKLQAIQDEVETLRQKPPDEVLVKQLEQEVQVLTANNETLKKELQTRKDKQSETETLQNKHLQQNESLVTELRQEITSLKLANEAALNDSLKLQTSQHEIQNLHQQVQNLQKNETLVEQLQQEVELLSAENEAALNESFKQQQINQKEVESLRAEMLNLRSNETLVEQLQQEVAQLTTQNEALLKESIKQQQASQKDVENLQKQLQLVQGNERLVDQLQQEIATLRLKETASLANGEVSVDQSGGKLVAALGRAETAEILVREEQQLCKQLQSKIQNLQSELKASRKEVSTTQSQCEEAELEIVKALHQGICSLVKHQRFKRQQWLKQQRLDVDRQVEVAVQANIQFNESQSNGEQKKPETISQEVQTAETGTSISDATSQAAQLAQQWHAHALSERQERSRLAELEVALRAEVDRLRNHLLSIEAAHTEELLGAEEREKSLRLQLNDAEQKIITVSASLQETSLQVHHSSGSLRDEVAALTAERDRLHTELQNARLNSEQLNVEVMNLQGVLEQFQRDQDSEHATELRRLHHMLYDRSQEADGLRKSLAEVTTQLSEQTEALQAAQRLTEQIDKKERGMAALREEVMMRENALCQAEEKIRELSNNFEAKVDKQVIKNLFLGYFSAPGSKRTEVLKLIAKVLDFGEEDSKKVGLGEHNGWIGGLWKRMSPSASSSRRVDNVDGSFSEQFVHFLERESQPKPPNPSLLNYPSPSTASFVASKSDQPSHISQQSLSEQRSVSPFATSKFSMPSHISQPSSEQRSVSPYIDNPLLAQSQTHPLIVGMQPVLDNAK